MRASILMTVTATLFVLAASGAAAGPKKGDLLVTDFNRFALFVIDPVTGNRTVMSAADGESTCFGPGSPLPCCTGPLEGAGCDPAVGAGPIFRGPHGVAVEADGNILVVDRNAWQIFRLDPATGDRTILSGNGVIFLCREAGKPWPCCTGLQTGGGLPPCVQTGTGPTLLAPNYLAVEANGNVLLADSSRGVLRVDPVSGDRTVVSSSAVGSGLDFRGIHGIALEEGGTILVAEDEGAPELNVFDGDIRQVDPVSGARTILSGHVGGIIINGSGPIFKGPWDVAVESTGDLLVTDFDLDAVFRVSPITGDRTILSGQDMTSKCTSQFQPFLCCTGSGTGAGTPPCGPAGVGPPLNFNFAGPIAVELNGSIVVVNVQGLEPDTRGIVMRVDPLTGDRTVVSSPTVGSGPELLFSAGIAVTAQDTPGTGVPALSVPGVMLFLLLLAVACFTARRLGRRGQRV